MNEQNRIFAEQYCKERNLSKASCRAYLSSINNYTQFNNMSMEELINEADDEEEDGIRLKRRTIKKRLTDFRQALIDKGMSKRTIHLRMTHIKSIYTHYEIEIPKLPFINEKQMKTYAPIMFKDLPTKSIIRQALYIADPLMKAIILIESSGGFGRKETLNLTIREFFEACGLNTQELTEEECLNKLFFTKKLIVPTFTVKRQKTAKYYYTFCSPECVRAITYYLCTRTNINYEQKLFKISSDHYYEKFREINRLLGLGQLENGQAVFRGHMLRKYHASHLRMGKHPLSLDEIDSLQGRSKNTIQETYFLDDPTNLKKRYIQNMNEILINAESTVHDRQQEELDKAREQVDKLTEIHEKRLNLISKLVIENPEDAFI